MVPHLNYEDETGGERNSVIFKINQTTIWMRRSRRGLSIDMVFHKDILKNNQITFFPYFTFIPKTLCFTGSTVENLPAQMNRVQKH